MKELLSPKKAKIYIRNQKQEGTYNILFYHQQLSTTKDLCLLSTIFDVFFKEESKLISTEKSSRSKGMEWQT